MPAHDQYGRYMVVPEGQTKAIPHTRVTTLARTLDDEFGLTKWRQRMVAVGVSKRPDLLAQIAACLPTETARLDALARDAVEAAGASSSANLGSALHSFAQRIDAGEDISIVPETWRADIEAYRAAMADAGFSIQLVERCCVIPDLQVAGTLDRVVERADHLHVLDLKTGQRLDFSWGSIAAQLALYAHAETLYDLESGVHSPMPEVDRHVGYVAWLPAGKGTCEIIPVDLQEGWMGAMLADSVRHWRKSEFRLGDVGREPEKIVELEAATVRREWLVGEVRRIVGLNPDAGRALAQFWPIGVPTLKESSSHSEDELEQIAQLVRSTGQRFRILFPEDPDPGYPVPTKEKETSK